MNDLYNKKITAVPSPKPHLSSDIDDFVIEKVADGDTMSSLNSLTSISYSRDKMYDMMDDMCADSTIASVLEAYVEDTACPNQMGKTVWVDSNNSDISQYVSLILKQLEIDKHIYKWAYSLIKYGDLYLKLCRDSDVGNLPTGGTLNEGVAINYYNRSADKYTGYVETENNPAEMFELKRHGKTMAYIKCPLRTIGQSNSLDPVTGQAKNAYQYTLRANKDPDITLYQATEYVHGSLNMNVSRYEETIQLFTDDTASDLYTVNRGTPLFYNVYQTWKQLKLLENSILLNRVTQSSILRVIQVETGNMSTEDRRSIVHEVSQMIKQKIAVNTDGSMNQYLNDAPLLNNIIMPTMNNMGKISFEKIGGDVNVKDLADVDLINNKLFGGLRVPKAYFGQTDDSAGFNGGESLALISLRYGKTVRRIQNVLINMITDLINLILYDRNLTEYIGNFNIKMSFPDTADQKNKRDSLSGQLQFIRDFNGLFDNVKLDEITQLSIIKSLLGSFIEDETSLLEIQKQIEEVVEKNKNKKDAVPAEQEAPAESGFAMA